MEPDPTHPGVQAVAHHALRLARRHEQERSLHCRRDGAHAREARPPVPLATLRMYGHHLVAALPELAIEHPAEVPGVPGEAHQRDAPGGEECLDRSLHENPIYLIRDRPETRPD